jgi:hypothetical protein
MDDRLLLRHELLVLRINRLMLYLWRYNPKRRRHVVKNAPKSVRLLVGSLQSPPGR